MSEQKNKIPNFLVIGKQVLSKVPTIAGNEAVRFFKKSFVNGGFTDTSLQQWPKAKSPFAAKKGKMIYLSCNSLFVKESSLLFDFSGDMARHISTSTPHSGESRLIE